MFNNKQLHDYDTGTFKRKVPMTTTNTTTVCVSGDERFDSCFSRAVRHNTTDNCIQCGDNTTHSSAPQDGHMVARNMLSNL